MARRKRNRIEFNPESPRNDTEVQYLAALAGLNASTRQQERYLYAVKEYVHRYGYFDPAVLKNLSLSSLVFKFTRHEIWLFIRRWEEKSIYILINGRNEEFLNACEKIDAEDLIADPLAYQLLAPYILTPENIEIYREYRDKLNVLDTTIEFLHFVKLIKIMGHDWMRKLMIKLPDEKARELLKKLIALVKDAEVVLPIIKSLTVDEILNNDIPINVLRKPFSSKIHFTLREYTKDEILNIINNVKFLNDVYFAYDINIFIDIIHLPRKEFFNAILLKTLTGELNTNKYEHRNLSIFARIAADADDKEFEVLCKRFGQISFDDDLAANPTLICECLDRFDTVSSDMLKVVSKIGIDRLAAIYDKMNNIYHSIGSLLTAFSTDIDNADFIADFFEKLEFTPLTIEALRTANCRTNDKHLKEYFKNKNITWNYVNLFLYFYCKKIYGETKLNEWIG